VPYTLGIVNDLEVSLDTPDQVRVEAVVQGRTLALDATLTEEEGAPRVDLARLNRLPLSFAGRIVSRGINRGLRSVVEEAGVRFEEVRVERNGVIIIAEEKR